MMKQDIHVAHGHTKEEDPKKYDPNYSGDEEEIEILKFLLNMVFTHTSTHPQVSA